mmetsp:Transcript_21508/g.47091  ORF Transcript_21508/g.47091 Transcript_21508/m.47091 type:complete len:240 (+) Transcript_21508:5033-5752(+)
MLAIMTAVLRLMGVSPWRRPRISRGTMMARAGDSTACTKVVAESLVMASPTSAGRAMQLSRAPTQGSMSRLPFSLKAAFMATQAAFLTCSRGSIRHSPAIGTISGSAAAIWSGAEAHSCFSSFREPSRVCHGLLLPMLSNSTGRRRGTAKGLVWDTRAEQAAYAASRTGCTLSDRRSIMRGKTGTRCGSAALPTCSARPLRHRRPPSLAVGLLVSDTAVRTRLAICTFSRAATPATRTV